MVGHSASVTIIATSQHRSFWRRKGEAASAVEHAGRLFEGWVNRRQQLADAPWITVKYHRLGNYVGWGTVWVMMVNNDYKNAGELYGCGSILPKMA